MVELYIFLLVSWSDLRKYVPGEEGINKTAMIHFSQHFHADTSNIHKKFKCLAELKSRDQPQDVVNKQQVVKLIVQ